MIANPSPKDAYPCNLKLEILNTLLTQRDINATKRGSDGFKRFPPEAKFCKRVVFPQGCAFGPGTVFSPGAKFLRYCTFGPDTLFGDFCHIGPNCAFSLRTFFGQRVWVGEGSRFDDMPSKPEVVIAKLAWPENEITLFNLTSGTYIHSKGFTGLLSDFPEKTSDLSKAVKRLAEKAFNNP